jgi:methylthioribose-1-phosphate isomerase
MSLQSIKYENGYLEVLDQLQLPHAVAYAQVRTAEDGWHAIKEMRVRGAPAIAIVAALALAAELYELVAAEKLSSASAEVEVFILEKLSYLVTSRPTAVNLSDAARKLGAVVQAKSKESGTTGEDVAKAFINAAEKMLVDDLQDNQRIGHFGAKWIKENTTSTQKGSKVSVLTHCNTGYVRICLPKQIRLN